MSSSQVVIFFDTNKLYGAFRYRLLNGLLHDSILKDLHDEYVVVVSEYVLYELSTNIVKKENILDANKRILAFITYLGRKISISSDLQETYLSYVSDPNDAQILQDAVDIQASFLLTNNTKDFYIKNIYDSFGILVINDLIQVR